MFLRTGEILEKATRVLTDEDKALLETEFVGKNGQRRKLEVCFRMITKRLPLLTDRQLNRLIQLIMGRQKLKKSLQYEIKWRGMLIAVLPWRCPDFTLR